MAVLKIPGNVLLPPPGAPHSLQQRHDLLWMSLGILIGYFVLSVVVKALDCLRGNRSEKLDDLIHQIQNQTNTITTRDRTLVSLQDNIRRRDQTIQTRDNAIANEQRQRFTADGEVTRLVPFEREANDLRPQVGALRDEIRNKNREIETVNAAMNKLQGDLETAYQRFEVVNQRAAEGRDIERNLRSFIGERAEALERIKAQHEEELDSLREKHDEEKEQLQQQRELDVEAVRRNANSELDGIIITKNRELAMLRREKELMESTEPRSRSSFAPSSTRAGPSEGQRAAVELHSAPSARELESGVTATELHAVSSARPPSGS